MREGEPALGEPPRGETPVRSRDGERDVSERIALGDQQLDDGPSFDVLAQLGHLDIVSANAGIESFAPAEQLTDEQFTDMLQVNLMGAAPRELGGRQPMPLYLHLS